MPTNRIAGHGLPRGYRRRRTVARAARRNIHAASTGVDRICHRALRGGNDARPTVDTTARSLCRKGALPALIPRSLYGGFFGAVLGILLAAVIALSEPQDIRRVKVLKNLIAGSVSLAAVMVFVVKYAVIWAAALPMLIGALLGGYAGCHLNRWLPGWAVRAAVICTGALMTALYALRYWF